MVLASAHRTLMKAGRKDSDGAVLGELAFAAIYPETLGPITPSAAALVRFKLPSSVRLSHVFYIFSLLLIAEESRNNSLSTKVSHLTAPLSFLNKTLHNADVIWHTALHILIYIARFAYLIVDNLQLSINACALWKVTTNDWGLLVTKASKKERKKKRKESKWFRN